MKRQLTDWEVKGFWPGEPLWSKSVETTVQRRGVTPWLPVSVPGGVHRALQRAGLIDDPCFGMNSLLCEWVEHRWWVYRTWFDVPAKEDRIFLRFDGIDDACWILLNGEIIAEHQGIYEPVLCEITAKARREEKNQLLVILAQPPQEQGQIGWTSKTRTQKARFGYKWDFCTRLVNIGLWQAVWLETCGPARIEDVYVTSDIRNGIGKVRVQAQLDGMCSGAVVRLGRHGVSVQEQAVTPVLSQNAQLDVEMQVEQPEIWYPNGMGGQPLYDVDIFLDGGGDEWHGRIGIRSLAYTRCDGADDSALPYCPVMNGETVYIRGVNMTPLDMCYGDVTEQDYRRMFTKLRHLNVNTLRVWGGGIIETETFYRLADENGFLVWQEFIQSSSGIDNIPSCDPAFLELLERNSRAALRSCRNHVSLTWWSGGNELADAAFQPITADHPNIAMLKRLVQELDPQRLFLPSSPSGPSFGLDDCTRAHHDVHGNWQYDGIRRHYEKYNASDSMLQSEFGADGMSSLAQLMRILPPEELGVFSMKEHPILRHHGEWWETLSYRDRPLFGCFSDPALWIAVSQMMQSEALRYILLSNRRRRGQNGGSMIWQMNEPYPNVSCTNLVEYYGQVKGAYYAVRRAYASCCVGLRYDSLIQAPGQETFMTAYTDDLSGARTARLTLSVYTLCGTVLHEAWQTLALNGGKASMDVSFTIPALEEQVWIARVTAVMDHGRKISETYFFSQREEAPLRPLICQPVPDLAVSREEKRILVENRGNRAAIWLHLDNEKDADALLSDNGLTLLPGERAELNVLTGSSSGWRITDLTGRMIERTI